MAQLPKVFISYSHDDEGHSKRIRALADGLKLEGLDVLFDQYEPHPVMGWPTWMQKALDAADYVLMVCTETYLRRVEKRERPGTG